MRQQEMQQQQQMQQEQIQAQQQQEQMKLQTEAAEREKERQKDITVAEIRAAGFGAQSDVNENMISDFQDSMKDIKESARYREQMDFKREQSIIQTSNESKRLDVEKEKLSTQRNIADTKLEIARENKNKYDFKSEKDKKKK